MRMRHSFPRPAAALLLGLTVASTDPPAWQDTGATKVTSITAVDFGAFSLRRRASR